MRTSLRLGTVVYGSAVLFERLLGLLLLPVLARALDRHDYGAWSQTAVAAAMLMPLVGFALSTAVVRSFSGACGARDRRRAFALMAGVVAGLFVFASMAVLLARDPLALLIYGERAARSLLPAMLALLAAEVGVDFALAWLRTLGRIGVVAGVIAARSVLRAGTVLMLVWSGPPHLAQWLGVYCAAQVVLMVAVFVLAVLLLRREAGPAAPVAVPRLAELLRFCAPLVVMALFAQLNAYVDRFLLVPVLGLDGLAMYSAAVSLAGVPGAVYGVLGFTLFPALARHWHEDRRDAAAALTNRALEVFVFLALPIALALALAGPTLLPLVAAAEYRAAPPVFALLGVGVLAFGLYQITLYALLLDGRSRQVLALTVGAALLNAVLNLWLAPRLGASGAAAAAALSNAALAAVAVHLAGATMPWRFPWRRIVPIVGRTALAALPLVAWVVWASWAAAATSATSVASAARAAPAGASGVPAAVALVAALAAGAALHLGLDLARPASVARAMLAR